jgi:hypothetical protein
LYFSKTKLAARAIWVFFIYIFFDIINWNKGQLGLWIDIKLIKNKNNCTWDVLDVQMPLSAMMMEVESCPLHGDLTHVTGEG